MDIDTAKKSLRNSLHKKRNNLNLPLRSTYSQKVCENILQEFNFHQKIIALYKPFGSEVDISHFEFSLSNHNKLVYPCIEESLEDDGSCLVFREGGGEFEMTKFKFHQPTKLAKEFIPEIIIVPLLGFDRKKNRIGYGGGYYDRTFAYFGEKNIEILKIGVAYSLQEVKNIPVDNYDITLDHIVTDKEIII